MSRRAAHLAALKALADRLDQLDMAGTPWPCQSRREWISDDLATLRTAATHCSPCPALTQCREAGRHEKGGVWGGRAIGAPGRPRTATHDP